MNLIDTLKRGMTWFDGRVLRERVLLVVAVAAVLYFFVDLAIVGVSGSRSKALKGRIAQQTTQVAALRKTYAELSKELGNSVKTPQQVQLEGMKRAIAEADARLAQLDSAPRVGEVVKAVLGASPGLELVSLKTLPVSVALDPKAAPAAVVKPADAKTSAAKAQAPVRPPRSIYRHGIEVTVKGNYLALLPYLEKLQNYPGRLYWTEVSVDVQTHPDAILKMTIYTMSGQADPSLG